MHFIEMLKPDGRILRLYGTDRIECANAAPIPRSATPVLEAAIIEEQHMLAITKAIRHLV